MVLETTVQEKRPLLITILAIACLGLCVAMFGWMLVQSWAKGDLIWRERVKDWSAFIPRTNGIIASKLFPAYGLCLLVSSVGLWKGWRWSRTLLIGAHVISPVLFIGVAIGQALSALDGAIVPVIFAAWAVACVVILMLPSSQKWFGMGHDDLEAGT